jgi:hypothetical protein
VVAHRVERLEAADGLALSAAMPPIRTCPVEPIGVAAPVEVLSVQRLAGVFPKLGNGETAYRIGAADALPPPTSASVSPAHHHAAKRPASAIFTFSPPIEM